MVKVACDRADSQVGQAGSTHVEVAEGENEVDLSMLPEKDRNKILNQRTKSAEMAKAKTDREAARTTAKTLKETTATTKRDARKVKKPKAHSSPLHLTETSIVSPSQNPHKRYSSVALLSASRLQQLASPSLMDMFRGSSSQVPYYLLMRTMWRRRPSPRNGWI